jgi:nucleotide-binding universal stress UspA family protein
MRVVVGVDGSQDARDALAWAVANAGADDRIEAVHAWELPLMAGYEAAVVVDPAEIEQAAERFVGELVEEIADPRVIGVVARGSAGHALVEHADQVPAADLVVVGHQGEGKIALLGSVANYVAHHASMPVVIVRGDRVGRATRLVVGVDDHDLDPNGATGADNESVRALQWAYTRPGVDHIDVLHAWFAPAVAAGLFASAGADMDERDAAGAATISRVMDAAGPVPSGMTVRQVVERGTPGFALVEASRGTDLVVVGSRRRNSLVGFVLGSTCNDVLADSHAPVAVIH